MILSAWNTTCIWMYGRNAKRKEGTLHAIRTCLRKKPNKIKTTQKEHP